MTSSEEVDDRRRYLDVMSAMRCSRSDTEVQAVGPQSLSSLLYAADRQKDIEMLFHADICIFGQ